MVNEEYLIVTCYFIGRRLVSPTSCLLMKTRLYQSNCQQYAWSATKESTVVADDDNPGNIRDYE